MIIHGNDPQISHVNSPFFSRHSPCAIGRRIRPTSSPTYLRFASLQKKLILYRIDVNR